MPPVTVHSVRFRALLMGLALSILVDVWIQHAELVMGSKQGHTALANTAIPVGAFSVLFVLAAVNMLCRSVLPALALRSAEVLTIYVMMTTSTVLSSSGQLHFLIPTIAAAFHYATPENRWASLFYRYIPHWLAQTDPEVLDGFYGGKTAVPIARWAPQIAAWCGFMLALAGASLCIVAILRRRWVDAEKLSFPTIALPLALLQQEDRVPILRQRLFWLGALIPFAISVINTLSLNIPVIPLINLRTTPLFKNVVIDAPWNAIGNLQISFYPFVLGIAYFASLDVSFSCWFFYLVTLIEKVAGAAVGQVTSNVASHHAVYPFLGNQGAGAFLGITIMSLVTAGPYLKDVFLKAIGKNEDLDDSDEPMSYRAAFIGLVVAIVFMVAFSTAAGMNPAVAVLVILLGLAYMLAATRIRAETGDAWLFGPDIDAGKLMTDTFGASMFNAHDLTVLAYLRPVIANFDLRCITMPHQMDGYKMAQEIGASRRALTKAIMLATTLGLLASFFVALAVWHAYGAEARTEPWRTMMGKNTFETLADTLKNRPTPDISGMGAVAFGFAATAVLTYLRTRFVWWPFHPVGYAIANTYTMGAVWMPFLLAWVFKSLALRYGGARFYKLSQPFFLGLIAGDLIGGGLFTAIGCFTGINVYPINW